MNPFFLSFILKIVNNKTCFLIIKQNKGFSSPNFEQFQRSRMEICGSKILLLKKRSKRNKLYVAGYNMQNIHIYYKKNAQNDLA